MAPPSWNDVTHNAASLRSHASTSYTEKWKQTSKEQTPKSLNWYSYAFIFSVCSLLVHESFIFYKPAYDTFRKLLGHFDSLFCFDQVSLVVLFMVGVIVYKLLVIHPLYKNPQFQQYAATIVSVTGSIMNLIIIMILSKASSVNRKI